MGFYLDRASLERDWRDPGYDLPITFVIHPWVRCLRELPLDALWEAAQRSPHAKTAVVIIRTAAHVMANQPDVADAFVTFCALVGRWNSAEKIMLWLAGIAETHQEGVAAP